MHKKDSAPYMNYSDRDVLRIANMQFSPRLAGALLRFAAQHGMNDLFSGGDTLLEEIAGLQPRHLEKLRDPAMIPQAKQMEWLERPENSVLTVCQENYPEHLMELPDPPAVLFVSGRLQKRDKEGAALIGSRHATPYGRAVAEKFAGELAACGVTVVSGGAHGIDTAAHRGALQAGGRTLLIPGCGPDVCYPRENRALFEQAVQQGAVASEYPPGTGPDAWRFPARNRIISGISRVTVVVEAGRASGALITAGFALEQGRGLLAVPGNIDREASVGCNDLLRQGVAPALETVDILQQLGLKAPALAQSQLALGLEGEGKPPRPLPADISPAQKCIAEHLSLTPRHMDDLARDCGLEPGKAGVELTLMELRGLARRMPGNCYIRVHG